MNRMTVDAHIGIACICFSSKHCKMMHNLIDTSLDGSKSILLRRQFSYSLKETSLSPWLLQKLRTVSEVPGCLSK